MTRNEFISRLRRALGAFPPETVNDIVGDYEAHFAEAVAAGRSEAEVAAALGQPERLARELRMEAGLARWEREKTPSSAAGALFALVGLGAVDILILIPFILSVFSTLFGILLVALTLVFVGVFIMTVGPFAAPPGGPLVAILGGLAVTSGSIALGALTTILTIWLINGVIWFGRLHYRLLKPVIDSDSGLRNVFGNNDRTGDPA